MPKSFENLHVYQLAEQIADAIWHTVVGWDFFCKRYGWQTNGPGRRQHRSKHRRRIWPGEFSG